MLRKIHTEFRSNLDNDTICSLLSSKINVDGCCYNAAVTKDHFKAAKRLLGPMSRTIHQLRLPVWPVIEATINIDFGSQQETNSKF